MANCRPRKGWFSFMAYKVLGYVFECKKFRYQGRTVEGLLYEVKTNEHIAWKKIDYITIELSPKEGFWIRLHQNARGIKVEPYKSYVLVPCKDSPLELEKMEISYKALMKCSDYFEDRYSCSPSSEYYID